MHKHKMFILTGVDHNPIILISCMKYHSINIYSMEMERPSV